MPNLAHERLDYVCEIVSRCRTIEETSTPPSADIVEKFGERPALAYPCGQESARPAPRVECERDKRRYRLYEARASALTGEDVPLDIRPLAGHVGTKSVSSLPLSLAR